MKSALEHILIKNKSNFHSVVEYNPATDKLLHFDFTKNNPALTLDLLSDTEKFSQYINKSLTDANAKYGIGGYNEERVLYKRSKLFETGSLEEARSIHLGIDIWGPAGTEVYLPLGGTVHSFAYNDNFGDYGATIIMQHQIETVLFHTLYGHLSLADLVPLTVGKYLSRGELLAHFGEPKENGDWPPHLHFQIIEDMRINVGDYPGVCTKAERKKYLSNCPDPDLVLNMMKE